ncbi:quinol dehydrogenase periplasmic component [compost metagenome]
MGGGFLDLFFRGAFAPRPRPVAPAAPRVVRGCRPPGAIAEAEFLERCTRCAACVPVCPGGTIKLAGIEAPFAEGTPFLPDLAKRPCFMCDDMPCIRACPEGALVPLPREDVRLGLAFIDPARCKAHGDQACDDCLERCPFPGVALFADEQGHPVVNPEACTGCGFCAYHCTATPGAIAIVQPAP